MEKDKKLKYACQFVLTGDMKKDKKLKIEKAFWMVYFSLLSAFIGMLTGYGMLFLATTTTHDVWKAIPLSFAVCMYCYFTTTVVFLRYVDSWCKDGR